MGFNPMDVTTKRILKKLGGDKISSKVLTYDGNGETFTIGDYQFATIADKGRDLTKVKSITVMLGGTDSVTLSGDALSVSTDEELGVDFLNATYNGMTLPAVVNMGVLGLAVFDDEIGYITRIEFAETIVPIDPKYLLKVIDLTQFKTDETSDYTFNDMIMALFQSSAGTGGTAYTVGVTDVGNALKSAIGSNNVKIRSNMQGIAIEFPVTCSSENGIVAQVAGAFVSEYGGAYYDVKTNIKFGKEDRTTGHIMLQATPITTTEWAVS